MPKVKLQAEDLICIICRLKFNVNFGREPFTQTCQHSICKICIDTIKGELVDRCPIDNKSINVPKSSKNNHLTVYLGGHCASEGIRNSLAELAWFMRNNSDGSISPQLYRKLLSLITTSYSFCDQGLLSRVETLFNRLIIDLIQAQYNTKQREQEVKKLIRKTGCSIEIPRLTDAVIKSLIKLYRMTCNNPEASITFERSVLVKFLTSELGEQNKSQIEKIIQTLYRGSCFHITPGDKMPSRLRLKQELCDPIQLRQQHDTEMIKLAHSRQIRLSPESWAYLLYGCSSSDHTSKLQSILDKYQLAPSISELKFAIQSSLDVHGVQNYINELERIESLLKIARDTVEDPRRGDIVNEILNRLAGMTQLFRVRQLRGIKHAPSRKI